MPILGGLRVRGPLRAAGSRRATPGAQASRWACCACTIRGAPKATHRRSQRLRPALGAGGAPVALSSAVVAPERPQELGLGLGFGLRGRRYPCGRLGAGPLQAGVHLGPEGFLAGNSGGTFRSIMTPHLSPLLSMEPTDPQRAAAEAARASRLGLSARRHASRPARHAAAGHALPCRCRLGLGLGQGQGWG